MSLRILWPDVIGFVGRVFPDLLAGCGRNSQLYP